MQTMSMPTCVVVKNADSFQSKQGLQNFAGISAETAGALQISARSRERSKAPLSPFCP